MEDKPLLRFKADGTFKLMQISDVQDSEGIRPRTKELLNAALDLERPDFVVLTGDQIRGYGLKLQLGSYERTYAAVEQTLKELLGILDERGIPFTFTYGNHDHDAPIPMEEQTRIYQRYPLCYAEESPAGVPGYNNHVVPIYPAQGDTPALLLYCMDSHSGLGFGYAPLEPEQVDWYRETRDAWAKENGGQPIASMLFQHVPVEEINELYRAVPKGTKGALEGYRNYAGKFYVLDDENTTGFMGELPSAPDINAGLFDAAQEKGEMIGMFFGHDHNNGFHGKVRGIPLGYAPSAGYNAYGPGRRRGVRVFHLNQNDLREYSTKVITDNELLGDSPLPNLMTLYDRMPSSFGAAKPMIRKGVAGLALGVGAAVALAVLGKKRKK